MCGLFGFLNYDGSLPDKAGMINALATESAIRGTDATGISYNRNNRLHVFKKNKSAYALTLKVPKDAVAVMGHTRHTTQGNERNNQNNHPFFGKTKDGCFSFAHNGILMNDDYLKRIHHLPKTKIETDSYVAVQLIEQEEHLNMETLKKMAEAVEGSFSFSVLDDRDNLYLIKGDSPLAILHFPKLKVYVYASTEEILWRTITETPLFQALQTGAYEKVVLNPGTILKISGDGSVSLEKFDYTGYSYAPSWRDYHYGCLSYPETEDTYLNDLKAMANSFGYSADEIQELHDEGFSYDEIEDFFYEISYGG